MQEEKEEQLLIKRIQEMAKAAYYKNILNHTDFLNLNEISIVHSLRKDLPKIDYEFYGGFEGSERQMFFLKGNDYSLEYSDYIHCIYITPLHKKFSDKLTHRDFLGAILNLGIQRSKIGDIVTKDTQAYVFCTSSISEFIITHLERIKHTNVKCSLVNLDQAVFKPNFIEITGSISSNRLDSLISLALKTSRSKILPLISAGKVFVNGRLIQSNSYQVKEDEVISIRGQGKFIYKGVLGHSKKGKIRVLLMKYN